MQSVELTLSEIKKTLDRLAKAMEKKVNVENADLTTAYMAGYHKRDDELALANKKILELEISIDKLKGSIKQTLSGILQDVPYDCISAEERLNRIHTKATKFLHGFDGQKGGE